MISHDFPNWDTSLSGASRHRRRGSLPVSGVCRPGVSNCVPSCVQSEWSGGYEPLRGEFHAAARLKGRVSIPGSFRSVLGRDGLEGLFCYPALDRPAIDAGGSALMVEIEALIGRYAPFSDQREQLALALYGTSETPRIDGEGRVVLSENLKGHAGITETVAFVCARHGSPPGWPRGPCDQERPAMLSKCSSSTTSRRYGPPSRPCSRSTGCLDLREHARRGAAAASPPRTSARSCRT